MEPIETEEKGGQVKAKKKKKKTDKNPFQNLVAVSKLKAQTQRERVVCVVLYIASYGAASLGHLSFHFRNHNDEVKNCFSVSKSCLISFCPINFAS